MHLVAARLSSSYCPTAHAMQPELPDAPAVEYVPTLHATHSVEALLSRSFMPAPHCVHSVALAFEKWPTPHGLHCVAGLLSRSACPAMQSTHGSVPPPLYCPAEQAMHGVAARRSSSTRPAAHAVHVDAPVPVLPVREPTAQSLQLLYAVAGV